MTTYATDNISSDGAVPGRTEMPHRAELSFPPWDGRAVMLLDMDAFFASVEQRDHPEWRGKPVIVGGSSARRGVVSTCSYEARRFGVHSAMSSAQAEKLCPQAIWAHGNFARYKEVSRQVMQIIARETPFMRQVSIDEAYADITPNRLNTEHPVNVARRIQKSVAELGITCSIGLATSMPVAKMASEIEKPRGFTAVFPGTESTFLEQLPIESLNGIGPSARTKLNAAGIMTLGQMARAPEKVLQSVFGVAAGTMRTRAKGQDLSLVFNEKKNVSKSISHEVTFAQDLTNIEEIRRESFTILSKVGRRLRKKGLLANTIFIKLRYSDRTTHTSQAPLDFATDDDLCCRDALLKLLDRSLRPGYALRLLGVGVSSLVDRDAPVQQILFGTILPSAMPSGEKPIDRQSSLMQATDALRDRFGEDILFFGNEMKFGSD